MFTIMALLIALVGCLYGIKKGFISAWILLFNVMISVYLSVMAVCMTGKYFPDSLPNQWAKAGDLLFTAVFLFVILQALSIHLFDHLPSPELPKYFDVAGAGICGFIAGYLVFWVIIYAIAITPIAKADFMKIKKAGLSVSVAEVGRCKIDSLSGVLECLSLQEDDMQAEKLYSWLETPKAKFVRKTKEKSKPSKTCATSTSKPAESCKEVSAVVKVAGADPNSDPNAPAAAQ